MLFVRFIRLHCLHLLDQAMEEGVWHRQTGCVMLVWMISGMELWLDGMSGSDMLRLVQGDGNDTPSTCLTSQKTLAFSKLGCL